MKESFPKATLRFICCLWFWAAWIVFCQPATAGPLSQSSVLERAVQWAQGHPVMGQQGIEVEAIETLQGVTGYTLYALHLKGGGYLLCHGDDRLPLVIAFSASSRLDLRDTGDNVLRALLLQAIAEAEAALAEAADPVMAWNEWEPVLWPMSDILIEPLMAISWNQNHPFNLLAPADPQGSAYYGYRVPIGCVATAFAMITHFHRWPVHGTGSHHYTDNIGAITGAHAVDFSQPFAWDVIQPFYNTFGGNPEEAEAAVGHLVYALAVAAEADFESVIDRKFN